MLRNIATGLVTSRTSSIGCPLKRNGSERPGVSSKISCTRGVTNLPIFNQNTTFFGSTVRSASGNVPQTRSTCTTFRKTFTNGVPIGSTRTFTHHLLSTIRRVRLPEREELHEADRGVTRSKSPAFLREAAYRPTSDTTTTDFDVRCKSGGQGSGVGIRSSRFRVSG